MTTPTREQLLIDFPEHRHGRLFRFFRGSCARDHVEKTGQSAEGLVIPSWLYHIWHQPYRFVGRPLVDYRCWYVFIPLPRSGLFYAVRLQTKPILKFEVSRGCRCWGQGDTGRCPHWTWTWRIL